jgi:hypothetical protein
LTEGAPSESTRERLSDFYLHFGIVSAIFANAPDDVSARTIAGGPAEFYAAGIGEENRLAAHFAHVGVNGYPVYVFFVDVGIQKYFPFR